MPGRNVVKNYVAGGVYHAYNRGVEKRTIFVDEEDFRVFHYYLGSYLLPPVVREGWDMPRGIALTHGTYDLHRRIKLLAFCLMPNHFHLLLRQQDELAMREFMKRLANAYVGYFNKKYKRVGSLFQGTYRGGCPPPS